MATEMTGNHALVNDFVAKEESSIMDLQQKESSKWTNEKHSLYLKSIEASFVDQLYNMQTCRTQNTCSSDATSAWKNHPSGQFKVLLRGCWSKKRFKTEKSHLNDADGLHVSPHNPWLQHFTNGSRKRPSLTSTFSSLQYRDSELHHETGCSDTEVTDQNFVQDMSCSRKRRKTSKSAHSGNDQVVPHYASDARQKSPILM